MYAGKKIKDLREHLGKTQSEMAEALGISQPYYSTIEKGKKPINPRLLKKLLSIFNIDRGYFNTGKESLKDINIGGENIGGNRGSVDSLGINDIYPFPSSSNQDNAQTNANNRRKELELKSANSIKFGQELLTIEGDLKGLYSNSHRLYDLIGILQDLEENYWGEINSFLTFVDDSYIENERFNYKKYRKDGLKILEKSKGFNQPMKDLVDAISLFLERIKPLDVKAVLDEYEE